MTEKELIVKLQELRQITPRKEWVFLTKKDILGSSAQIFPEEPEEKIAAGREGFQPKVSWLEFFPRIFSQYKLSFASLLLVGVLVMVFGFSQNAVPGDLLFAFKKVAEKAQTVFLPSEEQLKTRLELANKRLEELTKIAEQNQIKKLSSAIEECQASMSQVASKAGAIRKPEEARKIVPEIKKLESNLQNLKTYGVEISNPQNTESIYKPVVDILLKDLESRTLAEEQRKLLRQAQEIYATGNYPETLNILMQIQPAVNG